MAMNPIIKREIENGDKQLKEYTSIIDNDVKKLKEKIIDPTDLMGKINEINDSLSSVSDEVDNIGESSTTSEVTIIPGTLTYINGQMVYYDITKTSVLSYKIGNIIEINNNNDGTITIKVDDNKNFNKISNNQYYIVKRNNANNVPEDIPKPYSLEIIDESLNLLKITPINLISFKADTTIGYDIALNDDIFQSGSWQMLLSQTTELTSEYESTDESVDKTYISDTLLLTVNNQIELLQPYLTALENAGYSETDPDYLSTKRQLDYNIALRDFYEAIIACDSCSLNDESSWTDTIIEKDEIVQNSKEAMNVPPPSTKEIIIQSIEKIGLSVMGSIDIYLTGQYEDVPTPSNPTIPSYISDVSITSDTSLNKGTTVGIKGTDDSLGVNYLLIKANYNASAGGTGTVSFVLDVAEAAGISAQRGNYEFSAFSALFKIKERNFWDYTGSQKTWQYFVNMTPVTIDPDHSDYGKYHIFCQVSAYKYYHNAIVGARWFATMNKFRGF